MESLNPARPKDLLANAERELIKVRAENGRLRAENEDLRKQLHEAQRKARR